MHRTRPWFPSRIAVVSNGFVAWPALPPQNAIHVAPGTTVTWTNHDNFTHSVQVQGQSDVHVMKPGESAQITFDGPGTYAYVCTFHTQNMRGTVLVRGT